MKIFLFYLFGSVLAASGAPAAGYYDEALGKTGAALRAALHEIINDHTPLPYSGGTNNTEPALKRLDEDPANTNNVLLLYAMRSEGKTNFGTTLGWNREHLWPNSFGLDDVRPSYTDLFNLRAEDATVNSARGNKYYDLSETNAASYRRPGHAEAPLTSTDSDSWEPPDVVKGDIARALFYMDVRYEGDRTNELDLSLRDIATGINSSTNMMGRLSTLILWHEQDPVSEPERLRNDLIDQLYQHNRNPFVDHPEWVELIFKPKIKITRVDQTFHVSWPMEFTNATLHFSTDNTGPWTTAPGAKMSSGAEVFQTIPGTEPIYFFRLKLR